MENYETGGTNNMYIAWTRNLIALNNNVHETTYNKEYK